jgi:regulatory associated protein of mTOR
LTSDQVEGNIIVAGYADGALRLFDVRQRSESALVRIWKEHKAPIVNLHLQRGGTRELVSSSKKGEVKLWDIRHDRSVKSIDTFTRPKEEVRRLSVHEHAPVFAVGGNGRLIKLYNMNGVMLNRVELPSGWLAGAAGGISALAFHPHRMMLATAALGDAHVTIFGCGKGEGDL